MGHPVPYQKSTHLFIGSVTGYPYLYLGIGGQLKYWQEYNCTCKECVRFSTQSLLLTFTGLIIPDHILVIVTYCEQVLW